MTRKMAKSADQTSLGTTETAAALRSPPRVYGEPRRLLPSTPFQNSSGKCRSSSRKARHKPQRGRPTSLGPHAVELFLKNSLESFEVYCRIAIPAQWR